MCAGHKAQQRDAVGGDEPRDVDLLQDSVNWTSSSSKFHDMSIVFCQMSLRNMVFLCFLGFCGFGSIGLVRFFSSTWKAEIRQNFQRAGVSMIESDIYDH